MSCIENSINKAEGRVYSDEEPSCYTGNEGYNVDNEHENGEDKRENSEDDGGRHTYDNKECHRCADSEGCDADDEHDA